ncbi:MAG: class I SAM-dependent DNA methyltransferase [Verrucomicrobiia bacterium]
MTWPQFKKKWSRYSGKESSAYQSHFNDLCQLLGQPTPADADPTGSESFCFQKRVVKDAELLLLKEDAADYGKEGDRGFADVWKKDCFAWEYKGKKKNLDEAYRQLLRYRESLLNPPLLVVCDFDRYIVRTNFNGAVQETHEFTNASIDTPENVRTLRLLFTDPEGLRPVHTASKVTEDLAKQIAAVARSLQDREAIEFANARTRAEFKVAQKKKLRIARFLNRIIFCLFAEDIGLLPGGIFSGLAKQGVDDPVFFAERLEALFRVMAKGGSFGTQKIRYFNGHLFEDSTVFELTPEEVRQLAEASESRWESIEPKIMGTLFERALDPDHRAQLGAHYTSEEDIKTLVEPVLMQPLRREWKEIKRDLIRSYAKGKGTAADRARLAKFLKKLNTITVLDPACGSGNFLYISLQLLLSLEKEVIAFATQLDFTFAPQVGVQQLKAIEINAYAFELAQVSVQIGYLQWLRDNGFQLDRSPVLQVLAGFQNEDALLIPHYHSKAKTLKQARAKEHEEENALKFYTEREWPECDVIVSNPPFLGDKLMRRDLGDDYVEELRRIFTDRIPGGSDFCCYWFEKARYQIEHHKCRRAGLLGTQGIRGGANREVLKRIKETGDIFFAIGDRDWILDGANVHVSMVGFDDGEQQTRALNGQSVKVINSNLTASADFVSAAPLRANEGMAFIGTTKGGDFDIDETEASELLLANGNPHGKPNSDVVVPIYNGFDILNNAAQRWLINNEDRPLADAALYEKPHSLVLQRVKPNRDHNRNKWLKENWWKLQRMRPEMRAALAPLRRFIASPRVSKHRIFAWFQWPDITDDQTVVFAQDSDFFFGVIHSRVHEVWALSQGTQVRERESGFRYTPTTCFDNFPLPQPALEQEAAIAAAAKELNDLRERWLNPPEWTIEKTLEFTGSVNGPWASYVVNPNQNGIGTVRYPRLQPKDADCAKKLEDRTLTKLYNERPTWLDLAHKKLDAAVADAYGFPADLTDDQILERLLKLNLERAAAELKAGQTKKPKTTRAKQADELI